MNRQHALLLLPLLCAFCLSFLGGCVPETVAPLAAGIGADVAIFHRSLPDMVYSAVTGRDCSVVRLDEGKTYCRPVAPPVPPQPYCTSSLGNVDCWAHPELMPGIPVQVAQGPHDLTPAQNRARLARWPATLQAGQPVDDEQPRDPDP